MTRSRRFPQLTLAYLGQKGSLDYHLLSLILFDTEIPSVDIGIFGPKGLSSTDDTGIIAYYQKVVTGIFYIIISHEDLGNQAISSM